jgi:hypothetical protein
MPSGTGRGFSRVGSEFSAIERASRHVLDQRLIPSPLGDQKVVSAKMNIREAIVRATITGILTTTYGMTAAGNPKRQHEMADAKVASCPALPAYSAYPSSCAHATPAWPDFAMLVGHRGRSGNCTGLPARYPVTPNNSTNGPAATGSFHPSPRYRPSGYYH